MSDIQIIIRIMAELNLAMERYKEKTAKLGSPPPMFRLNHCNNELVPLHLYEGKRVLQISSHISVPLPCSGDDLRTRKPPTFWVGWEEWSYLLMWS